VRLAFLGSPPFALPVFEETLASGHEVSLLVTPPDRPRGRGRVVTASPLVEAAQARGVEIYQPRSSKDDEFIARLSSSKPDVLLVASYGEILRQDVLDLCPHGALNVHASLLPRWRGASPIQYAIRSGDEVTGVSVQKMVLALDAGDVMCSAETPIAEGETAGELLARLAQLGGRVAVEALDALEQGSAAFTPQDADSVTLAPKLKKEDGWIDWNQPARRIDRMVRSVTPWPGARSKLPNGKVITVERLRLVGEPATGFAAGEVCRLDEGLFVACADELVEITNLKPEGKGSMAGDAFLRGARLAAKERMESKPWPA